MTSATKPLEVHQDSHEAADMTITGMDCADCAVKLERAVAGLPGIAEVRVDFGTAKMHLAFDQALVDEDAIKQRVRKLGYDVAEATPVAPVGTPVPREGLLARLVRRRRDVLTVLAAVLVALAFILEAANAPSAVPSAIFGFAILAGGYYIALKGINGLRLSRTLDINLLMTIAVVGAVFIGEWEEAAMVVLLFSLGETLEGYTVGRARNAIRSLMELAPAEATVLRSCQDCEEHLGRALPGGGSYGAGPCPWCRHEARVPVAQLALGDRILVRPGDRIPMDGRVLDGSSSVNQAPITGESLPVDKSPGSDVFAGTVNGEGGLELEVTRLAKDNTLARIIHMVEESQAQKAPTQRFVDSFARYYTPAVVALAALVAVVPPLLFGQPFLDVAGAGHGWLYRALSLLIVACPCALVISTPVSIVSAISNAARHGVLIKGGAHLEAAGALRAIALDKTGTLTRGEPVVTDIVPLDGLDPDGLLALGAAVETGSRHPLARAIVAAAQERGLALEAGSDFRALTGRGVSASLANGTAYVGNAALYQELGLPLPGSARATLEDLEADGKTAMTVYGPRDGSGQGFAGIIALADTPRPEARRAIEELHRVGIEHTIMLTGDNERAAKAIAARLGVREVKANLLPQDKSAAIGELLAQYGSVGMVGDGINDAPALARATVGIAMGGAGSDQALETADIALMADDLTKLPFAMRLSRRAAAVIRQNVFISLAIKLVFLALVLPGLATLWMAVFADVGASLIVILNGMRLLRERGE